MYCPSCENLMPDDYKHCGQCGMFLNKTSERVGRFGLDFSWIWRRSWGGFAAGFVGWIIVFFLSRMIGQSVGSMMNNLFAGTICGIFLGTAGGILEESAYKTVAGGVLGMIGGAIGGLLNIPLMNLFPDAAMYPVSVLLTWAAGGACIGATSGIFEKNGRKVLAGVLFGLLGGALGGYLGSVLYGSIFIEFRPENWFVRRLAEGVSGAMVGGVLWLFIGMIEKLYLFRRQEDSKGNEKVCGSCGKHNPLQFWYCSNCGTPLQTEAPRQKIAITPFRGIERVANAFSFLSRLFIVTGIIAAPVIFLAFLPQSVSLAFIGLVLTVLFAYLLVVVFRFIADVLCWMVRQPAGHPPLPHPHG